MLKQTTWHVSYVYRNFRNMRAIDCIYAGTQITADEALDRLLQAGNRWGYTVMFPNVI